MKDFLKLAEDRYSVRQFSDKKIEKEKIRKILKAGQVAPTACNKQPQRIFVIESEKGLEKLRKCTECHFNAPLAMLICYDKKECWKREFDGKPSGDIDASIVTTHMMLEAANLGIGSTWIMYYVPEAVKKEFKLGKNLESTAILVMGYPKRGNKPSSSHFKNKPIEKIVKYV